MAKKSRFCEENVSKTFNLLTLESKDGEFRQLVTIQPLNAIYCDGFRRSIEVIVSVVTLDT